MLSTGLVRSVLDSAPDAMIIIDATGTILFANDQLVSLFGHSLEEVVGAPIEILLPERFRTRHCSHRENFVGNLRVRPMGAGLDLFGIRKDGSEFPVEISLSPVHQGSELLIAAAIRDITDRKLIEQKIKDARREAERANLAKSRFLATASHDLRQPLQTLNLLNGALRRSTRDPDCLDMLQQQEQALEAMSRLLNALLDISRLESGAIKLDIRDFDLAELFDELRREFTGIASSKELTLSIPATRARVHSDPALVGQILRNLLSNAVKYTPRGGVELRCEARGDKLRLEIRDTGVGIPRDKQALIFEEFYQVGVSPHGTKDGYGLGLSIVQRILKLLDLAIDIESEPGKGTSFAFELPLSAALAAPDVHAQAEAGASQAHGASQRVLLVEDEPGVRKAMRKLLDLEGYDVTTAATAAEAERLLKERDAFDLILTDYHLEDARTGTQVISLARSLRGDECKAILVTGDTSSAVRELKRDANLRVASKPINSGELLGLVRELLAR